MSRRANTWRVYASGDDARTKPWCRLCRTRVDVLIVGGHTLPPPGKPGTAGGVKRIGLCIECVRALAVEPAESHDARPGSGDSTLRCITATTETALLARCEADGLRLLAGENGPDGTLRAIVMVDMP